MLKMMNNLPTNLARMYIFWKFSGFYTYITQILQKLILQIFFATTRDHIGQIRKPSSIFYFVSLDIFEIQPSIIKMHNINIWYSF